MMKITKIQVQKYNKNRYSIFLEDEYGFSVSDDVLVKYGLFKGMEVEKEFIDSVLIEEEKTRARNTALKFLGHRIRSKREIEEKLQQKGLEEFSEYVIGYLEENGYLNDLEFAISFAKDKHNLNKFGKKRIRIELLKKGVKEDYIEAALEEVFDDSEEIVTIKELALKKINGSYKKEKDEDKYRKVLSYLYRKGYSYDSIVKALKEVL